MIRCSSLRRGLTVIEVIVVVFVLLILVGLLIPATARLRETSARDQSRNNLKQIGLAIHQYASAHNTALPNAGPNAKYWFCGVTKVDGKPGPSPKPDFVGGILSFMEGNTKCLSAPLDPNLMHVPPGSACSYSIPASWAKLDQGKGNLYLPASFPRGTSQSFACAEMTTFGVTYNGIQPFSDAPYTLALANTASTTANSFSNSRCQVVLMDGSVKMITQAENTAEKWSVPCDPMANVQQWRGGW